LSIQPHVITIYDKTKITALKPGTYSYLPVNAQIQRGLDISKEAFTNVYGLGQKFFNQGQMNDDLVGKDRETGDPKRAPFGNQK